MTDVTVTPQCFGSVEVSRPQSRAENCCDDCLHERTCSASYRIAALADAQGEPVAWMYARGEACHVVRERVPDLEAFASAGWTETPLYTHPPAQAEMCKHYVVERDSRGRRTCVSCGTALTHPPAQDVEALVEENKRLQQALVDHNDCLRSAHSVASRDGAETNWLTFRGAVTYTLAEHHETVVAARTALAKWSKP